jgi:DNA-binding MarR family transcriptional regulator
MALQHEIGKRHPFHSPEEEAHLNLLRTAVVLDAGHARLFKLYGLSASTYNILRILRGEAAAGNEAIPMQTIGERLITRVPDVTRLVDRLERAGFVERCRTREDRRLVLVSITGPGLAALEALDTPLEQLLQQQFAHMTREELAQLSRLLVKARTPTPTPTPTPGT